MIRKKNISEMLEPIFLDLETLDNKPFSPIIELSIVNVHGNILFNEYILPSKKEYISED